MRAKDSTRETQILRDYVQTLKETIPVEAVVLFGSRARNEALRWSDFDLAVVSNSFERKNRLERMEFLLELWKHPEPAEIFGFTVAEFSRADRPLLWEIIEYGKPLVDTGVFRRARQLMEEEKKKGELTPVPGGWRVPGGNPQPPD